MSFDAMEQAIVARLQDKLGATVRKVYTAAEVAQIEEGSQVVPSCTVVYNGYAPVIGVGGSQGRIQQIDKTWVVVIAVRSATEARTQTGARQLAAPIVDAALSALLGWRPDIAGEMPLQLVGAPGAEFTDAGFAYYPLSFTNRRTYRGID